MYNFFVQMINLVYYRKQIQLYTLYFIVDDEN